LFQSIPNSFPVLPFSHVLRSSRTVEGTPRNLFSNHQWSTTVWLRTETTLNVTPGHEAFYSELPHLDLTHATGCKHPRLRLNVTVVCAYESLTRDHFPNKKNLSRLKNNGQVKIISKNF
jgi:hypothetical protein